jgi:hypothetical protein
MMPPTQTESGVEECTHDCGEPAGCYALRPGMNDDTGINAPLRLFARQYDEYPVSDMSSGSSRTASTPVSNTPLS